MKVTPIAWTVINWDVFKDWGMVHGGESVPDGLLPYVPHLMGVTQEMDELGEITGRLCYKSWNRPNPKTATNQGYLDNILKQGHESVLEHSSVTFWLQGVSRTLTHELVRHRHLSFSQVSQRYVDESESQGVLHPTLEAFSAVSVQMQDLERASRETYEDLVETLEDAGLSRKKAREAARGVLLGCWETEMVVTGNIRAWRDVIKKRNSDHADEEIHLLAGKILKALCELAPNSVQDLVERPCDDGS